MPRAIQAKRHSLQVWEDGSKRSYPPAPISGGGPTLSLTPGATSMQLSIAAEPPAGLTVVELVVQRLISGVWTDRSLAIPFGPSELPARSTKTPTKYVHPSGTLGGNSAYTSIPAAMAAAVPGDEIVVGGTYSSNFVWTVSGTPTNRIRIRPFDYDNPPIIDGGGTQPIGWAPSGNATGSTSLVNIQAEYVTFDGFIVRNSKEHGIAIGACNNNGAFFFVSSPWYKGIEVYRCVVSAVSQGLITWKAEDWKVGGCDFSKCQNGTYWETSAGNPEGWGSAISMAGRNAWFCENVVRQTMGEGIHVGHHINVTADNLQAAGTRGFTIRRNVFYDCWSDPIYLTIGSDGIVEENLVFMSNDERFWWARSSSTGYPLYGIGVGGELGAFGNPTTVYDADYNGLRDVKIRNNIINGANRLFAFKRFEDPHKTKNIEVDHNTIFCTKGAFPSIYEALFNNQTGPNELTGVRWRNNAVLVSDPSDMFTTWNALGAGKVSQGSLYSHAPPSDLASATNLFDSGSTVIVDKAYSATSTGHPNPVPFDVTKAAPYLSGSTVSPLVNASTSIGLERDFHGRNRPTHTGKADIGAISLSLANALSLNETGLANSTAYQYRARARWSNGVLSDWSDVKTATTGASGGGAVAPTFDQIAQSSTNLQGTGSGAKNWSPALTGVDAGDVVLVQAVHLSLDTPGAFNAMLAPAGYHLLGSDESDSGDWGKAWWWFHIWEAGDVDPTFTADNSQGSYRITGQAAVYKSNASGINKLDHTVASSGTSTGGSTTTLQNSGATWTPDQWANHLVYLPASGKYAMVASNTETQLSLRSDIGLTIGSGLSYEIRALKFAKQRNATASSNVTAPGLTPAQQPSRLVSMYLGSDGNTSVGTQTLTVPGSMSKRGEIKDNNTWSFAALADEVRSNLSATGTRVATFPSVAPESWGASIVIRGG
jgi:hypothetical protein